MLAYPITLREDEGSVLAVAPDFPELITFGEDRDEALARAVDALEEAIAARISERKDVPAPSAGRTCATLPALTAIKTILYQSMREQGVGRAELARRLGCRLRQVDRLLDLQRSSRLDQLDAALQAVGRRLEVTPA